MYLIIIFILLHIIFTYITHINGKKFYKKKTKIYDIGHKYLINFSKTSTVKNIVNFLVIIYILILLINDFNAYEELLDYLIPIFLFRNITINTTILPKDKNCNDNHIGLYDILFGHCYDKIFSGHMSVIIMTSFLIYKRNIIKNKLYLVLFNLIMSILILSTRGHYTIDVLMSAYISICNYMLKINTTSILNFMDNVK